MNKPFIIGITGGSGSGKTTFIKRLKEGFSDREVCVISQDDYYRPRNLQPKDDRGIVNFDRPKSIYKNEFTRDIKKLMEGKTVTRKEYTFNNDEVKPRMLTFYPAPIIIVEGLFIFHYKKVERLLDVKIFLHAKENLKVIRRIRRDQAERNYPLEDVLYRYENHVLPTFEKYIQPYVEDADLVINNNSNFEMGVAIMRGFLKNKLGK